MLGPRGPCDPPLYGGSGRVLQEAGVSACKTRLFLFFGPLSLLILDESLRRAVQFPTEPPWEEKLTEDPRIASWDD